MSERSGAARSSEGANGNQIDLAHQGTIPVSGKGTAVNIVRSLQPAGAEGQAERRHLGHSRPSSPPPRTAASARSSHVDRRRSAIQRAPSCHLNILNPQFSGVPTNIHCDAANDNFLVQSQRPAPHKNVVRRGAWPQATRHRTKSRISGFVQSPLRHGVEFVSNIR